MIKILAAALAVSFAALGGAAWLLSNAYEEIGAQNVALELERAAKDAALQQAFDLSQDVQNLQFARQIAQENEARAREATQRARQRVSRARQDGGEAAAAQAAAETLSQALGRPPSPEAKAEAEE